MTPLRPPQKVAQINSIWGSICARGGGAYNSNRRNSLYIKNIRVGVCQGRRKRQALDASRCFGLAPGSGYLTFVQQRRRIWGRFAIFVKKCRLRVNLSNQKLNITDGFQWGI